MNKLFSKIAALSVGLAMAVGVGVALGHESVKEVKAADANFTLSSAAAVTVDGVTASFAKGSGSSAPAWYDNGLRLYVSNTITISSESTITGVSFNWEQQGSKTFNTVTANVGSYSHPSSAGQGTWTGEANEIVFTCGTISKAQLQLNTFTVSYGGGDPSKDTLVVKLNDATESPQSLPYSPTGGWLFYANDKDGNDVNSDWTSSDESVFTVSKNGNNVAVVVPHNPGTANLVASADGFNDGVFVLTVTAGELESIEVTGSMSKTSYCVGEAWNPTGLVATGTYDTGYEGDVTSEVTWSYNPASPAVSVASVTATATIGSISGDSAAQTVTVTKANQIQEVYSRTSGSVDVYGYYVGYLTHTKKNDPNTYYDIIIQDGEYGIMAYEVTSTEPTYIEKETVLHVTGTIDIYNGLYEVKSPVVEVATSVPEAKVPSAPVVYAAKGGETQEYASRLTTVTGIPSVSGTFPETAGSSDITITMDLGNSKTVQVFYKKAAQNADAEAFAAVKAAVAGGTEITVKGFTGWYKAFQVQMNGYVPAAEGYTAEQFAQDLLDQTDAVCIGWKEGDNNHDALVAIWSNLAANDKYPSLPTDQKTILAEAERDEEGTVVEQAMARYDFLTGKYNLSNFINGRTPIVVAGSNFAPAFDNNNSYIIIIVISAVSVMSFGLALFLRKKRSK